MNTYTDLLEFRIVNFVNFPLATRDELGYRYPGDFSNVFTFIGKNNRIIGTLGAETSIEEIDAMLKRTMASFYGIYLTKEKENILLTENTIELDLKDYFLSENYSETEFVIKSSSNPYIVQPVIQDTKLILERTSIVGFSDMEIIARVPGKEIYAKLDIKIINPSSLYEDFEIADMSDSQIPWEMTGSMPWTVTSEQSYFNSRSIRSGRISPNEISGISLKLDLAQPGTLIFAYKTSTRPYFDRLHFFIDDLDYSDTESTELWSGLNDWRIMSFSIRAGLRSIRWEYIKGPYDPFNDDIVWLDMIVVPDKLNKDTSTDSSVGNSTSLRSFPNPFNPATEIRIELIKNEHIELIVFDAKGRQVADIHRGELEKGVHSFSFDGSRLSSGIYYSVLKYGDKILTNKLILAK